MSIQAIGTRRLDQLNISNFEDYTKQLPSVSFQQSQSGGTVVYMRGVATGGRRQPLRLAAVGRHLSRRAAGDDDRRHARRPHLRHRPDRKPRRAAGHALRRLEPGRHDPHHHQQARAGRDLRPRRRRAQHGRARRHGRQPRRHDQPADRRPHRVPRQSLSTSATPASSTMCSARAPIAATRRRWRRNRSAASATASPSTTSTFVEDDINTRRVYGGRAALKIDLNDNWTVTPTIMHQNSQERRLLRLRSGARRPGGRSASATKIRKDKFTQAALTDRRQGRQFRRDLCRRLHAPADLFGRRLHRLCRRL